jgi:hypothetical protein
MITKNSILIKYLILFILLYTSIAKAQTPQIYIQYKSNSKIKDAKNISLAGSIIHKISGSFYLEGGLSYDQYFEYKDNYNIQYGYLNTEILIQYRYKNISIATGWHASSDVLSRFSVSGKNINIDAPYSGTFHYIIKPAVYYKNVFIVGSYAKSILSNANVTIFSLGAGYIFH